MMKRSDVIHKITNLRGEEAHKWVVDTYNSIEPLPRGYKLQNKDAWCASTVSVVLHDAGYDDLAECSCPVMTQKAKNLGIWVEDDAYIPKAGDIIMYDWQDSGKGDDVGVPDHVGIVVKVTDKKITVREGNKGGTVGNRTIDANAKYIRGYITPPYEEDKIDMSDVMNPPEEAKEEVKESADQHPYKIGEVYTVSVNTALNVRRGAGKNNNLVGYQNLTPDGKKHAYQTGALKNGTRVTCLEVKVLEDSIWMRIPSGWICCVDGKRKFVI